MPARASRSAFLAFLLLPSCAPSPDALQRLEDTAAAALEGEEGWWSTVSSQLASDLRAFQADGDGGWRSSHPAFEARVGAEGVTLHHHDQPEATSPSLSVSVSVEGWGRWGDMTALDARPAEPGACTTDQDPQGRCLPRLERDHGSMTEWWASRAEGLEFGMEVHERPEGEGPLVVQVGVAGAEVEADGEAAWLTDAAGELWTVSGLVAWDADGEPLDAWMEGEGGDLWLVVDDSDAAWPIFIDPLLTTATTTLTGGGSGYSFGGSVASAGDVNGDGYDDVIIGATGYSSSTGRAYIYHGSSSGVASSATTTLTGAGSSYRFGTSVAGAGDVNNDGYDDVIVGADGYSSGAGRAYIHHGSSSGVSTSATRTLSGAGSSYYFGYSVAGAGDVNNDGYDDVIIGAYGYSSYTGRAYVYHGSSSGIASSATTTLSGSISSEDFGLSVAGAGDVNGDGYDDVIVGAYGYSSSTGRAYVYHGRSSGVSSTATATLAGGGSGYMFGYSVDGAGDVNGDGYDDVVVGAYGYSASTGRAYVHHGSSSGVSSTVTTTLTGAGTSYEFGESVASVGDYNKDGYSDVIIGASGYSSNTGRAYIYPGSSAGTSTTVSFTLTGGGSNYYFGRSASGAGDVNGDGYSDVIVGAHGYSSSTGRVSIYQTDPDSDGDGYKRSLDCDDTDALAYPGAAEVAGTEKDESCDGIEICYVDSDRDKARLTTTVTSSDLDCKDAGEALATASIDCDDADNKDYPGATELVGNEDDEDCDGGETCYADLDVDGFRTTDTVASKDTDCTDPGEALSATAANDCDDSDADDYPGAVEAVANEDDEDCNGGEICYGDLDGDGFRGTTERPSNDVDCADTDEFAAADPEDCDDAADDDYPGAVEEVGNDDDEDCDGGEVCYEDADDDGFLDTSGRTRASANPTCTDPYEATQFYPTTDCDDLDAADYPGATETVGNGDDEDCDGTEFCYTDADDDGYRLTSAVVSDDGDCNDTGEALIEEPPGDCDDADEKSFPGAGDTPNDGIDQDCDGQDATGSGGGGDGGGGNGGGDGGDIGSPDNDGDGKQGWVSCATTSGSPRLGLVAGLLLAVGLLRRRRHR